MVEKRSTGYMIFLVVFMGLVSQLDGWLSLIETTAVPFILTEFSLTSADFGFWQGVFGIIVFFVFFIGWFADAYGRKMGILALLLVMGIPSILIGMFSFTFTMFLIFYSILIMGTTSNLWEVPVAEESPPERRGLYGSIAFLIGIIPLSAIIGIEVIDALGWRWGYGVMFFLMLILLVMLFFMKEPQRWVDVKEGRETRLGIREALVKMNRKDAVYILASTLVYLIWTISFKLATTYGGVYYMTLGGLTIDQWKPIALIGGILLPISALISGVILDKVGRKPVLIVGSIGSAVSFILLGFTGLTFGFWGIYFFMAMVLAWIYVYLAEIFPTEIRTTSIGTCVTGARFGYVIGPLLASTLLVLDATMLIFWVVGGILMFIPLLALLVKPFETKGLTLEKIEEQR
jgi:MFS family permease